MTERFALRHARTLPLRLMTISLAALLATSASHAQTLPTPDREEQRRRAQAQSQERQQQRAPRIDLQENPPSAGDADASPLPAEPLCFRIDQVGLDTPPHLPPDVRRLGVYALPQDPFHFAHLYLQRYAGECIGREGAGLIVRRLTRRILERGYTTTRIGIPEQDLSSGVQVNGELWATQLNVITGSNQVRYADLGVQVIQGDGDKPTVGIDVAQLGGMYANKIRLIGTEAGVGVRGLGGIAALAGDLGIDSQGKVTLNGSTYATGNIAIAATDGVANAGTLYGQQAVTLNSQGQIGNSGTIAAQGDLTLTGGSIESTGALAAGLDQHGQIGQTGHLAVTASGTLAATGYHLGAGNVALQGASLDLSGATTLANGNIALRAAGGDVKLTGATTGAGAQIRIEAQAGTVRNDATLAGQTAHIDADSIRIHAAGLSNRGGILSSSAAADLAVSGALDNSRGTRRVRLLGEELAQAANGKHDYEVRGILGCQNLNCNGYKTDPNYADHNYNAQFIAPNQSAYKLGQQQLGTGQTYDQLVTGNLKKNPVGAALAGAGMIGLGVATGGGLPTLGLTGTGAVLGTGVNSAAQLIIGDPFDWTSAGMAGVTGAASSGVGFAPALLINTGGALAGSGMQGQNPNGAMAGAAVGTAVGFPIGAKIEGNLNSVLNPWYRQEWKDIGMGISTYVSKTPVPSWTGGVVGNSIQELTGNMTQTIGEKKK